MSEELAPTRQAALDAIRKNGGHLTVRVNKDTFMALGVFLTMAEDGILERVPNDHLAEFTFRLVEKQ